MGMGVDTSQGVDYGLNRQANTNINFFRIVVKSSINPTEWTPRETSPGIIREKGTTKCLAQTKESKTPAPTVIRIKVVSGGAGLTTLRAWGKKIDLDRKEKVTIADGQSIPLNDLLQKNLEMTTMTCKIT